MKRKGDKNRDAFTFYSPTSLGQNMIIMRMKTRQDIFIQYYIVHILQQTDLAPQVAKANRGGPGTIKINHIC